MKPRKRTIKRRQVGDWVWLPPYTGFLGPSDQLKAEIVQENDDCPCMMCDDPDCMEWPTLWTEPHPETGERYPLYHVSECRMYDYKVTAVQNRIWRWREIRKARDMTYPRLDRGKYRTERAALRLKRKWMQTP